jgi:threonine dehydratase
VSEAVVSVDQIKAARERIARIIKATPLDLSATFSRLCGREIYLKLENLQKTGSFKVRGASNKIQLLDPQARVRGVVAASAGNHAQGVAYAGRMAGIAVTVVMPETASFSKMTATAGYGAQVVLAGHEFAEAHQRALEIAEQEGKTFIPAFDDADIVAGQGTVGLELIEQLPNVDTIVVPVGGGGLVAGIIAAVRGSGCRARVIGVQAAGAASLVPSLRARKRVEASKVDTIADGLATRSIGALPFEIIRDGIDDAVDVTDPEVAAAIVLLLERAKTVVEGAGAVGLAACLAGRIPEASSRVAVVISGGNIDTTLLDRIIKLGLVTEGRLFRFATRVPDRPGELRRLTQCIADCGANIHQIRHERALPDLLPTEVSVIMELETRGHEHVAEIRQALGAAGYAVQAHDAPAQRQPEA